MTGHWWDDHSPEDQERFARAANDLVRNWMANGIKHRAGLHSKKTGREAIRVAGNMGAPGAERCFREVASKLGAENTVAALLNRPPHKSLFPRYVLNGAQARLGEFAGRK